MAIQRTGPSPGRSCPVTELKRRRGRRGGCGRPRRRPDSLPGGEAYGSRAVRQELRHRTVMVTSRRRSPPRRRPPGSWARLRRSSGSSRPPWPSSSSSGCPCWVRGPQGDVLPAVDDHLRDADVAREVVRLGDRRMSACPACRLVSVSTWTRNSFTLGRGHQGTYPEESMARALMVAGAPLQLMGDAFTSGRGRPRRVWGPRGGRLSSRPGRRPAVGSALDGSPV